MIFSRRSRAGRHAKAEAASRGGDRAARRAALLEELELSDPAQQPEQAPAPTPDEESGPYDIAEAPRGVQRVDLGSLLIPAIDEVEIRAQAAENGTIQQLELSNGANALQLGVFAAPRTDSLWEEVRPEIRKALFADGVGAEEVAGRWGTELRARLRTPQGFDDLRFVGIDGPRWMVRAVFRGPAAVDPANAGPLNDCLTGLVVNRDEEARPTREALPLRLPQEVSATPEPDSGEAPAAVAEVPKRKPSPRPRKN
ncbi:MAG TPA: DUF3710 domain-containing protein [Candidatus Limnocylindrales bacterium]